MTSYTTVKIGRAFEAHSLRFLNHHLNMSLRQVGGSGDEGIDLKGWWYVPSNAKRLESIVQSRDQALLGMPDRVEAKGKGRQDEKGLEKQMEEDGVQESPADWTAGFADDLAPVDVIRRLRVVGQCKAERVKLNARPVRELEGVMGHLHGR